MLNKSDSTPEDPVDNPVVEGSWASFIIFLTVASALILAIILFYTTRDGREDERPDTVAISMNAVDQLCQKT
jgi:hypothetical protein